MELNRIGTSAISKSASPCLRSFRSSKELSRNYLWPLSFGQQSVVTETPYSQAVEGHHDPHYSLLFALFTQNTPVSSTSQHVDTYFTISVTLKMLCKINKSSGRSQSMNFVLYQSNLLTWSQTKKPLLSIDEFCWSRHLPSRCRTFFAFLLRRLTAWSCTSERNFDFHRVVRLLPSNGACLLPR